MAAPAMSPILSAHKPTYRAEGFLADGVLYLAGILAGGLLIHAEPHEEIGQQLVALIHARCDFHAGVGQRDESILFHGNISVSAQPFCRVGTLGLVTPNLGVSMEGYNRAALTS